jgi:hypothetical protein
MVNRLNIISGGTGPTVSKVAKEVIWEFATPKCKPVEMKDIYIYVLSCELGHPIVSVRKL